MSSFFPLSVLQSDTDRTMKVGRPACGSCKLDKQCGSPKLKPARTARILFVGEAPSVEADASGRLVPSNRDDSGLLRECIKAAGADNSDWTYITALACRPENGRVEAGPVDHCRPSVINWIREHKPNAVILLGAYAIRSVIGALWKDGADSDQFVGWKIPDQQINAWVIPTFSPEFASKYGNPVMGKMLRRHIELGVKAGLSARPWAKVPAYERDVIIQTDQEKAADTVRSLIGKRPVAFDYETNMLKPDHRDARIVCYSVSDGKTTLATPMTRETRLALKELLTSGTPMIASNMKFEDRWTNVKLGVPVKNWAIDTMLAAHVLDNRPRITSIKFQAYVRLGQRSYDDHIKPFLKTKGGSGYEKNNINRISTQDLLLYCGLDSLLEWKVAQIQHAELKGQV